MKYFLHDSNAFNDEKITELFINFGYEGLGLFYTVLEKLAQQEKPIKTEVLKHQLKVGKKLEKCWKFMETLDILSSNNGETFNKQLLNFSEKYKIKSEKNAKRISDWRNKQEVTENVTRSESVCNTPKVKESKVKESKVKESKENKEEEVNLSPAFLRFLEVGKIDFPNVLKMKEPLTELQLAKLIQDHGKDKVVETLKDMHNWKPLLTKNTSANRTCEKWIKKDNKPKSEPLPGYVTHQIGDTAKLMHG
jgi:hypothetical protein